jgi:hypothetical protein
MRERTQVQPFGRMLKTAFGYANLSPVLGCRICMLRYVIISSSMKPAVNLPQLELWCRYYFTVYHAVLRIRDAYPGSRILIITHPDPGSRIPDLGSRIPDPKQQQKRGVKKNLLSYFFCSHKYHKIEKKIIFEMLKEKFLAFSKNYRSFYPKICH